ncbi:hypothetical protein D9M69_650310 [compost metagenome]
MQQQRIVIDHTSLAAGKHARENAFGHLPVLQHIRYAGRGAQVIFQDIKRAILPAYQVNARNMHIQVVRHFYTKNLAGKMRTGRNQFGRDDPVL